jgi:phenylalanyl-tRNA synthetase beta chain
MIFSLDWLLGLVPAERDAARIARLLTARGLTVDSIEESGEDHLLDVDVPANRGDCLGHLGLARELAAGLGLELPAPPEAPPADAGAVRIDIDAPELCPRYSAGIVRGVTVGPSPAWVVRRLEACGLRSVNNVVDVSNLIMLELGQPVHFFDLDQLTSVDGKPHIRVRRASEGEQLTTLDGVERTLSAEMLLIADGDRGAALAGVIGGADTEIGDGSRNVLVEAAHFEARSIRMTARRLAAATDASYRFERGVDPELPVAAQAMAASLLTELAGGQAEATIDDAYPGRADLDEGALRPAELRRLLGFEPKAEEVFGALESVGLAPRLDGEQVRITVPSWRSDLQREADLVEEVARHIGYDAIPGHTAADGEGEHEPPLNAAEERARETLVHLGFHEAIGYAMIGAGEDARFVPEGAPAPLALDNPIAEPLAYLRRSVLPGLIRSADLNLRRGNRDVRLFEVGRVFDAQRAGEAPHEPVRAGLVWSGAGEPRHWSRPERAVDLYDLMGVAEQLLASLAPGRAWRTTPASLTAFHPGRAAQWSDERGNVVAWGGALHPELGDALDQELFLLELSIDALVADAAERPRQRPVPRLPSAARDLSLLVTDDVPYGRLLETLGEVEAPAPVTFEAIDRYRGKPLAEGESSLTVRVTLQPLEQTLTDAETEGYREALVARLEERLGVKIRG